jgi:hypothetical protein
MKRSKSMKYKEFEKSINSLDTSPILNNYVRQVRWLYNNGNKCTMVYDEKLVRTIVHKLKKRIDELETKIRFQGDDL